MNDLALEVSRELAADIAKRKAELLPAEVTLTVKLELDCQVKYDFIPGERGDFYQRSTWDHVDILSVTVNGVDVLPLLTKDDLEDLEYDILEARHAGLDAHMEATSDE